MGRALSVDLRDRVVAAVEAGLSRRKTAERFGVSVASAIRWTRLSRLTSHVRPKPVGGDQRSRRIEACAPVILAAVGAKSDITLVELRALLAERGVAVAVSSLWRFFARRNITVKKSAHAAEQDRSDVLMRRRTWFDGQLDLDPARIVFVDETGASTRMARPPAAAPRAGSGCGRACPTGTERQRASPAHCARPAWAPPWCLMGG